MIKKIILISIFILMPTLTSAQYYKYTDENGKLRFTDDISKVPPEQRKELEIFKSEGSNEQKAANTNIESTDSTENKNISESSSNTSQNIESNTLQAKAVELDAMQIKLKKFRELLANEQASLQAQIPREDAPNNEKIAYSVKVEALNARITQYEKELKVYGDKVNEFNASRRR
ncbi:MAG: DUF4124 domain-containing protein [Desulfamplus sp.]|nr:DUF4124 domain-containing protein [Desulfamplus sp.]